MFFDWLAREGGAIFSWWLLTLLAGVAVFPMFFRLMGTLPGRGYPLARAAGLMLIGFTFWILNCFGLLRNTPGSTILAALIVFGAGIGVYVTRRDREQDPESILQWLRKHLALIGTTEVIFALMFFGWCVVRALNPSLVATEKPMEMAFLSGIRRSATFPPNDPWMSGYAISYYHFGYIIMATLANMTGVSNGMAFNLVLPLLFALTGTGAFGIAYDLVAARLGQIGRTMSFGRRLARAITPASSAAQPADGESPPVESSVPVYGGLAIGSVSITALAVGALAAILVVIMGNLGVFMIEIPFQSCTAPEAYLRWMNLEERDAYPIPNPTNGDCGTAKSADPNNWNFWWWFRDSRVLRDYDLGLNPQPVAAQPITEFPQFSFVLSDMHPHVLALPFAMLSIGLAFNLTMRKRRLYPWEIFLYGIFVGGMVFLNSWDGVYLVLIIAAEGLRRLINNGTGRFVREDWRGIAVFGVAMFVLTGLLYLPFFISFRSQVQGIYPNLVWGTQFQQFFLMFGPFLVILVGYLIVEAWRASWQLNLGMALRIIGSGIMLVVAAFLIVILISALRPDVQGAIGQMVGSNAGLASIPGAISILIVRRFGGVVTESVLLIMLLIVLARLFPREPRDANGVPAVTRQIITYSPSTGFTLLLIAAGASLTLFPDFFYLQDGFGVRINTVFKLYYQSWLLWSVASAFGFWSVLSEVVNERQVAIAVRSVFGTVSLFLILLGLMYPLYAINSRAIRESDHSPDKVMTLDGGPSLAASGDDYAVIQCLAQTARSDKDVVAEATQPNIAYNITGNYGRVAGLTGIPTLLGWDNHERQWRGSTFDGLNVSTNELGQPQTRQTAIARLYNTTDWDQVKALIKQYGITYIYVGPTERRDFEATGVAKFDTLKPVCASGNVAVYSTESIGAMAPTVAGD